MSHVQLRAQLKIRPGQLEGFKAQVAEIMRLTREKDTRTLRFDWFISEDGTQCEVYEAYDGEEGFFEHSQHIMEAKTKLFSDFAFGEHHMTAYGDVPQRVVDVANIHAGGLERYAFLEGLQLEPMV